MIEEELKEELKEEIAGVYAFYGRAFANGFDSSPNYVSEDLENFLGYDVSHTLDRLAEEDIIEKKDKKRLEESIYRFSDEEAKAEAFMTWKVLRDEFDGDLMKMSLNFDEAQDMLSKQNVKYAQ